jgi:NAD(P)-dependent dehydrogenase (short-subunit alcohol dehydrogenase family)
MSDAAGKVIIITGGAGGIGRAITRTLLDYGIRVAVMDCDANSAGQFVGEMQEVYGEDAIFAIVGDVANEADCQIAVAQVVEYFGQVDGLINNAGIGVSSLRADAERNLPSLMELSPDIWRRFFDINVHGAYLMTRAVAPNLIAQGWGRIINNTTSFFTMLRVLPYGATKAALESASAVWAKEFEGSGITVNVLVPGGPTDTAFIADEAGIDRTRMIRPEQLGPPALWLVSEASDGVSGRRFIAAHWDAGLPPDQAAAKSGSPIGWPELAAATVVWPQD